MPDVRDEAAKWAKARFDIAVQNRSNFETLWQEITRMVIPRESTYTETVTQGQERQRHIVDSTAPRALELFASFLATTGHNPSSRFYKTKVFMDGAEVTDSPNVKIWQEEIEETIWAHMNAAGVQPQLHKIDIDLGSIGTGALIIEKNSDPGARSRVKYMAGHMQNVYLEEDEGGKISAVFREVNWTAEKWARRFPDRDLGSKIKKALDSKEPDAANTKFPGFHMSLRTFKGLKVPGDKVTDQMLASPVLSMWVLCDDVVTIEATGEDRFKYAVPRWYTTRGEPYGRSPAMTVMPEIRMANRMRDTILRSAEKAADPPQLLPDGKLVSPLRLFAGGVSFTDGDVQPQSLIGNGTRYDVSERMMQDTRDAIRDGFFVPLFATPDAPVKTATQVLQETDERNRAVSPMIIRLHEELLKPLLEETFLILDELGVIPEPPPGFEEATIGIEYISPILAAQKQTEALGTVRLLEGVLPWVQATENAGILDKFNEEKVAEVLHEGSGAPAKILASSAAFRRAKNERAAAEEQALASEQNTELLNALSKFQGGAGSA